MPRPLQASLAARAVHGVLVILVGVWVLASGMRSPNLFGALAVGLAVLAAVGVGRRWPVVALAAAFGGLFVADSVAGTRAMEDVHLAMVVWSCFLVGRWAPPKHQPWAAAAVLLLLSTNVLQPNRDLTAADAVFPTLLTAAPWLLGLAVQLAARRADQAVAYADELASTRHADIRRATDEERLRIAHELHDVVAHNISALSLQTQVVRRQLEAGVAVTTQDLAALEETARMAMTDLRRLLGVLRPAKDTIDTSPSEGIDDLPALITRLGLAGHEVHLRVQGEPRALPPALSLVAYRIIQEGLSNARRHGDPGPASVQVDWQSDRLVVRVHNPFSAGDIPEPGHGRLGMAERARLFGGTISVRCTDGSWCLEATLPTPVYAKQVTP